jgi:hypothetical protein
MKMTQKQKAAFEKASSLLPNGWIYDVEANTFGKPVLIKLWSGDQVNSFGMVSKHSSEIFGDCTTNPLFCADAKKALNRVAAAIWHKQPAW